jgi:hypothetical protein
MFINATGTSLLASFNDYGPVIIWWIGDTKCELYCRTYDEARYHVNRINEIIRRRHNCNMAKIPLPRPTSEIWNALKKLDCDCRNRYDQSITDYERKLISLFLKECAEEGYSLDNWTEQEQLLLRNASHGSVPICGTHHYLPIRLTSLLKMVSSRAGN